mgnify:CR=1 FL=1
MSCNNSKYDTENYTPLQYAEMFIDRYIRKVPSPELSFLSIAEAGGFTYQQGIFLRGIQVVFKRDGKAEYNQYIIDWIASVTDENGIPNHEKHGWLSKDSLDFRQPGDLFFDCYEETKDPKYLNGLDYLFQDMKHFKRTTNGCFYHSLDGRHDGQVYVDGLYMAGPESVKYAVLRKDPELLDIAMKQPILMWETMRDETTGLLRHAWDESKEAGWADNETGLSGFVWSRAIGWYAAAITQMYEAAPKDHKDIPGIRKIIKELLENVVTYQAKNGRWYQLIDKGTDRRNWIDNSGTFLILYAMAKAVKNGILDESYTENIMCGYKDVIENSTLITDDTFRILDICAGTCVGENEEYYYYRQRVINDFHGIAGFLLMCAEIDDLRVLPH